METPLRHRLTRVKKLLTTWDDSEVWRGKTPGVQWVINTTLRAPAFRPSFPGQPFTETIGRPQPETEFAAVLCGPRLDREPMLAVVVLRQQAGSSVGIAFDAPRAVPPSGPLLPVLGVGGLMTTYVGTMQLAAQRQPGKPVGTGVVHRVGARCSVRVLTA
jgi:hypothetical protein